MLWKFIYIAITYLYRLVIDLFLSILLRFLLGITSEISYMHPLPCLRLWYKELWRDKKYSSSILAFDTFQPWRLKVVFNFKFTFPICETFTAHVFEAYIYICICIRCMYVYTMCIYMTCIHIWCVCVYIYRVCVYIYEVPVLC